MKKDSKSFLLDIEHAIKDIQGYLHGMKKEDFFVNILIQDGSIRKLSIIGEAVKNLPRPIKNSEADIPWKKIAGMRDIVVHDYSELDLNVIWNTIQEGLSPLEKAIRRLLKKQI